MLSARTHINVVLWKLGPEALATCQTKDSVFRDSRRTVNRQTPLSQHG